MNILKTITERTRERIREQEKLIPPAEMRRMAEAVLREEQAGAAANSSGGQTLKRIICRLLSGRSVSRGCPSYAK